MPNLDSVPYFHGIYAIRHRASGTMYVGFTTDLRVRWQNHQAMLRAGKHDQPLLQAAWDADGQDGFELVMLERIPREESIWDTRRQLRDMERQWMLYLVGQGITLYNRSVPRPAIVTVAEWNSETMLPQSEAG